MCSSLSEASFYLLVVPPRHGLVLLQQALSQLGLLLHAPLHTQTCAAIGTGRVAASRPVSSKDSVEPAPPLLQRVCASPNYPHMNPRPSRQPAHLQHELLLRQVVNVLLQRLELLGPARNMAHTNFSP